MKKQIIVYVISALIIIGGVTTGVCLYQSKIATDKAEQAQELIDSTKTNGVAYTGEAGKTALDLLKKSATIVASGSGENTFVTSINGVAANSKNQYWAFYINGESASVGAGSYVTKDSDKITWKLESF